MKNKLPKYFLIVAIVTFVTILVVLAQKSYSNIMGPVTAAKSSSLLKPIDPNLDVKIIDDLIQKKDYDPAGIGSQVWYNNNPVLPSPTSTP